MSKVTCPKCSATFSSDSTTCPGCGHAIQIIKQIPTGFLIAFIVVDVILVAGVLATLYFSGFFK